MADSTSDKILFRCHACRQKYAVDLDRVGSRTKCKKCQVVMQVPKENSLDHPEASRPTVHVKQATAKATGPHQSIAELSFDDDGDSKAGESQVVEDPTASATRRAHANDAQSGIAAAPADRKKTIFDATPTPAAREEAAPVDSGVKEPGKAPPGKKLCPGCHHACPTMALSCPLCQHRFETPKPKPKPAPIAEPAAAVGEDSAIRADSKSGSWHKSGVSSGSGVGAAGATAKPKKDAGKQLDSFITERKKLEGRPVEPPMWMDENVYGIAFKMGFAGLCCLAAGVIVFIQLDSPESARNAFFLIKWIYAIGGRWVPSFLCLAGGAAFLYFAIKPVVAHIKREKAIDLSERTAKASHAASFADE